MEREGGLVAGGGGGERTTADKKKLYSFMSNLGSHRVSLLTMLYLLEVSHYNWPTSSGGGEVGVGADWILLL